MNARWRALNRYCEEEEEYIKATMDEYSMSWGEALTYCLTEDDEYFRELFQEELEREDLTAGE